MNDTPTHTEYSQAMAARRWHGAGVAVCAACLAIGCLFGWIIKP